MKVTFPPLLIALLLSSCSEHPQDAQQTNRNRAMLEHNDVSLAMQQAWGRKPRSEADTQAQRAWEQKMQQDCHGSGDQALRIGEDLNAIYCEISAMQERTQALNAAKP